MIAPIHFYVQGIPKGQPRVKAFARKMGSIHVARVYTPGTAEEWKSQVALAARQFIPAEPLQTPLCLRLEFSFPRPRSHYFTGKRGDVLRDDAPAYRVAKPDIDNAAKAVMDALTILRMWRDDAQIVDCRVRKLYDEGRGPGCTVEIREA